VHCGFALAAALGQGFAVDGLIYSTFAMAIIALFFRTVDKT